MIMMTRLRAMRLKYGVTLVEIEKAAGVCNQQLSRLELGNLPRTVRREERVSDAVASLIAVRKSSIAALEQDYLAAKEQVLGPVEVETE